LIFHRYPLKIYTDSSTNLRDFIEVTVKMNGGNPDYIRPLDQDVRAVFDPAKNKYLKAGQIQRWLLRDDAGQLIGRIAAFVNPRYKNKGDKGKFGGIGFFDCVDQQEAANLLFDTAKNWLAERGMVGMDGPINMGDRDRFWGLLTEGFHPAPYGLNYNPPYYQKLFEQYGFQVFYNQICWKMEVASGSQLSKKFYEAHARFSSDPAFSADYLRKKNIRKYAEDFATVYNKAWAGHQGNKEMTVDMVMKTFDTIKPIMDERLVWFSYHNGKPITMWLNLPDINQIFRHFHGKFHLWNKLRFLYLKKYSKVDKMMGVAYGVVPEFQGSGVDYYMIVEAEKIIKKQTPYKQLELQWQGDFNPKMLNISKNLGAKKSRNLITYRYLFDRDATFQTHPVL
jgi:hypothetical protein